MDKREQAIRTQMVWKLASLYPNVKMEVGHIDAYVEATAEYPVEMVQQAILVAARKSPDFIPAAPRIVKVCRSLQAAKSGIATPEEAWAWVVENLGDSGRRRKTEGFEQAEQAVQAIGGWEELGQRPTSERHWTRKNFLAAYQSIYAGIKEAVQPARIGPGTTNGFARIGG